MEPFDSCDAERRSELDVFQTGRCLQRECHLTLCEEVVKRHSNQTFLENAKRSRTVFVAFDKYTKTNSRSSSLGVLVVTQRHFQAVLQTAGGEGEFHQAATMTAAPVFTVDAPLLDESKK